MSVDVAQVEQAIEDRFDRLRMRFAGEVGDDLPLAEALFHKLAGCGGGRLLDVGCGRGRFLPVWQRAGLQVIGLDRSAGMMLAARRRSALVQASARHLPFADATFDAVCAVESIAHFPDLPGSVAEMHRVLRPGGQLLLVDKNVASLDPNRPYLPAVLVKWIDEHRGLWMYPRGFAFRERWFWRPALTRLLRNGFERIECEYVLSPEETNGRHEWLFRRIPAARRRMLVSGTKRL